jgi:hypothetical protein
MPIFTQVGTRTISCYCRASWAAQIIILRQWPTHHPDPTLNCQIQHHFHAQRPGNLPVRQKQYPGATTAPARLKQSLQHLSSGRLLVTILSASRRWKLPSPLALGLP